MAALTQLTVNMFQGPTWTAFYKQLGGSSAFKKSASKLYLSSGGPTSAFAVDTLFTAQFDLAGSGTVTYDIQSFTDYAGQATQTMVRAKALFLWLFSPDDSTDVTAVCSGLTLGGAGSNPATLMFGDAASDKISLKAGGLFSWMDATANGVTVASSSKNILLTNLDSTNRALGRILVAGGLS